MAATDTNQSPLFLNFLQSIEPAFQQTLIELYTLVKSVVPNAGETFSYQVHCFKDDYMLVGLGANKGFVSLYTMSSTLIKSLTKELAGVKISGMTLHFPPGQKLPASLITKVVKGRVKENAARKKK